MLKTVIREKTIQTVANVKAKKAYEANNQELNIPETQKTIHTAAKSSKLSKAENLISLLFMLEFA